MSSPPFDPDDDQVQRALIAMWAGTWATAVDLQAERVLPVSLRSADYQTDVYLFVLALRETLRCAEWAKRHADGQRDGERSTKLNKALAAFDEAVPGATELRNVLTHFDEYERGKGDMQKKAAQEAKHHGHELQSADVPRLFLNQHFERDGRTTKLYMFGITIDITAARAAASDLAGAVIRAVA